MRKLSEWFTTKERWCKDVYFRDEKGRGIIAYSNYIPPIPTPNHPEYINSTCLAGGIGMLDELTDDERSELFNDLSVILSDEGSTITSFNDRASTTFEDVVKLVRKVEDIQEQRTREKNSQ